MTSGHVLDADSWSLSWLGLKHPFFTITSSTVIYTWIIIALLALILLPVRRMLANKAGVGGYIVKAYVSTFMDLCEQTIGSFSFVHFSFITAIFTFILLCNTIVLLPWMEEPTKDLNTTLALGIIAFVYTQWWAIKEHGIIAYIKEYLTPIFLMLPLHVIGKLATIISISFRLFGNIFGGAIISHIWLSAIQGSILLETFGLVSGINLIILLFFGLFEGFLQAFVFAMLSLTYLSIALQGEEGGAGEILHEF
jgi:F-type H+-transporting ATPase subunit a